MTKPQTQSRNKQSHIIAKVKEMATEKGAGAKLPTAQVLAKTFGVTLTTLDRSLAKLERKGIITRKQGSGIYVSDQLFQKRVGLLFGKNLFRFGSSTFYLLLLQQCEIRAHLENEAFSFYLTPPNPNDTTDALALDYELAESLKNGRLDGLLLCEISNPAHHDAIKKYGIPAVSLSESPCFPCIELDSNRMIRLCVENLAEKGCKTVGLLGVLRDHVRVFRAACRKHGLEVIESCIMQPHSKEAPPYDSHEPLGREWMQECVEQCGGKKALPDGIVITDDMLARGACLYLDEIGSPLGKSLKIATHANKGSLALEYWKDTLSFVEFDPKDMVEAMFEILESGIAGGEASSLTCMIRPKVRDNPPRSRR